MDERTIARFWSHVDKRGPDDCWPWIGANVRGYGYFQTGSLSRGTAKTWRAPRVAVSLDGRPPGDAVVMHRCDNPPCCNPAHLELGTHRDNARDKVAKGRSGRSPGAANGCAKLTDADAAEILRLRRAGVSGRAVAKQFGVSDATVCNIFRGKRWTHLPR